MIKTTVKPASEATCLTRNNLIYKKKKYLNSEYFAGMDATHFPIESSLSHRHVIAVLFAQGRNHSFLTSVIFSCIVHPNISGI